MNRQDAIGLAIILVVGLSMIGAVIYEENTKEETPPCTAQELSK